MTATDTTPLPLPEPPWVSGGTGDTGHLDELRTDPIALMTRVREECGDVGEFEIGKLGDDLRGGEPCGEQVEDINDANPHAAHAGPPPALVGIDGDPVHQFDSLSHGVLAACGGCGNIAAPTACATRPPERQLTSGFNCSRMK